MKPLDRSLIRGIPVFSDLQAEALDRVLLNARARRYSKGVDVFTQGETAEHFFLLLDGHVRVIRTSPNGEQVIPRYINAGEMFGIAIALGRKTYPATACAAVDCVAIVWPNAEWNELAGRFPCLATNILKLVGERLQESQDRVVELSTNQVEQRIAYAVLRLANQSGRQTEDGIEIDFPITRQDIAEMTGTTLHTVSRLLSAWENSGFVRGGRQKVTVTDPHALMLIAENQLDK